MTWVMIFFSGLKKSDVIYSIIIFLRVCWYIFSLFGRLDLRSVILVLHWSTI